MATSVRLPETIEQLVTRIARRRRQTKSEVIRQALMALGREGHEGTRHPTPYGAMKHLIGCASGGPPDLSVKTGEKFRTLLRGRRPAG